MLIVASERLGPNVKAALDLNLKMIRLFEKLKVPESRRRDWRWLLQNLDTRTADGKLLRHLVKTRYFCEMYGFAGHAAAAKFGFDGQEAAYLAAMAHQRWRHASWEQAADRARREAQRQARQRPHV